MEYNFHNINGRIDDTMFNINFDSPCKIFFIGIGGISMSGFAHLLHCAGFTISGSDMKKSDITSGLEKEGINIFYTQCAQNITSDIDLVVYTAAIHNDHPEFVKARELGIPMMDRAQMIGQVMLNYKNSIAVSGTHGKTTTTSMLSHIFLDADLDPTISVGGILKAINSNIRIGKSENFITEACEYTNSFLKFNPFISIILNVEEDHMDFFKDIDDIRHSFREFALRLPAEGLLVINGEIDNIEYFTSDLNARFVTYGIDNDQYTYTAKNIIYDEHGFGEYDLYQEGNIITHVHLGVVGRHNISNSLAAIAVSLECGISVENILNGLTSFSGTVRRFEFKGTVNGVDIIDDYAHHPTEIRATLTAAKNHPHKTLWVVFQPHTYTRTKAFLKDFAAALSLADKVVLADIYAARESDPGDISSRDIQKLILNAGKQAYYLPSFDEIEKFLLENCINGDLLITMGAGNVFEIGESLLGK